MKNLLLIFLLVFAAVKSADKPVGADKAPVKPIAVPKVPHVYRCYGEDPAEINRAFRQLYKYMQKNEKEKQALKTEITFLNLRLDRLEKVK
jgi:uncharacterized protein YecT (DUF1311 family)